MAQENNGKMTPTHKLDKGPLNSSVGKDFSVNKSLKYNLRGFPKFDQSTDDWKVFPLFQTDAHFKVLEEEHTPH